LTYSGESASPKSSEVVFFLGAGASVKAGVPTTYSFVNEYINSIENLGKRDTIKKIVNTLEQWKIEQWKDDKIDIELLLETLTKLKDKKKDPISPFYTGGTFILDGYYDKEPLINDLKNFIKNKAIVESEEKIRYLESFREIIEEERPLDIISVNYDTSIEQFCNCYRLTYQDGFDVYWNPAVFQKEHTDIRLYKIHGSVMWYQSDRGGYIKLPVMVRENKVQLITGEKAENLMLYPMQKWDYAEPLLELLVEIKHLLEYESCKFLIVVGYSFRDDHITRILWDVARKNRELHLLLISPNAYQTYSKKLKYYNTAEKIPSSLDGRVICLPYLFEKVLPYVKNHYLKKIKEGFGFESSQHQIEIRGEKANWISCLQSFADAEYIEKIESFLKREPLDEDTYWSINLEIYLKMAVNLIANGEKEKGVNFFRDFCNILNKVMVERIDVRIVDARGIIGVYQIEFKFNSKPRFDTISKLPSDGNYIGVPQFKGIIEPLSEFSQTRAGFIKGSNNDLLKISEKLEKMKNYLGTLKEGKISIEDYIKSREDLIPNIEQFTKLADNLRNRFLDDQQQYYNEILVKNERNILKGIIEEE
jgi:hypothetical protein